MQEKDHDIQHVGDVGSNPSSEVDEMRGPTAHMKHNAKRILLVPQPSDDPSDPLVFGTTSIKLHFLTVVSELVGI